MGVAGESNSSQLKLKQVVDPLSTNLVRTTSKALISGPEFRIHFLSESQVAAVVSHDLSQSICPFKGSEMGRRRRCNDIRDKAQYPRGDIGSNSRRQSTGRSCLADACDYFILPQCGYCQPNVVTRPLPRNGGRQIGIGQGHRKRDGNVCINDNYTTHSPTVPCTSVSRLALTLLASATGSPE